MDPPNRDIEPVVQEAPWFARGSAAQALVHRSKSEAGSSDRGFSMAKSVIASPDTQLGYLEALEGEICADPT
eukprot:7879361-Alexandrium_andersonii.AAC.1